MELIDCRCGHSIGEENGAPVCTCLMTKDLFTWWINRCLREKKQQVKAILSNGTPTHTTRVPRIIANLGSQRLVWRVMSSEILWMDKILHHYETMVEAMVVGCFQGN